jgi:hypothetical protein
VSGAEAHDLQVAKEPGRDRIFLHASKSRGKTLFRKQLLERQRLWHAELRTELLEQVAARRVDEVRRRIEALGLVRRDHARSVGCQLIQGSDGALVMPRLGAANR